MPMILPQRCPKKNKAVLVTGDAVFKQVESEVKILWARSVVLRGD